MFLTKKLNNNHIVKKALFSHSFLPPTEHFVQIYEIFFCNVRLRMIGSDDVYMNFYFFLLKTFFMKMSIPTYHYHNTYYVHILWSSPRDLVFFSYFRMWQTKLTSFLLYILSGGDGDIHSNNWMRLVMLVLCELLNMFVAEYCPKNKKNCVRGKFYTEIDSCTTQTINLL